LLPEAFSGFRRSKSQWESGHVGLAFFSLENVFAVFDRWFCSRADGTLRLCLSGGVHEL